MGNLRDHIMNKSMIIFTGAVLLMLVSGCTQPAPAQPATTTLSTPVSLTPQATVAMPPPVMTAGSVSPTVPNAVSDNTIRINKKGFDPANITVKSGSAARWVNQDSTADPGLYNPTHRIVLVNVKDSPLLSPGQSWSWIFDQPGSYDYHDMIHPALQGTIIVV
jgi:plastocyanin